MFPPGRWAHPVENEYRLTPAMASRKLQVVSVVLRYRERWGQSPSYRQIGAAMDIDKSTVRDAVGRAIRDRLLQRSGPRRELVAGPAWRPSPEQVETMIAQLRAAGVILPAPLGPDGRTIYPLPPVSELEHIAFDEGEA